MKDLIFNYDNNQYYLKFDNLNSEYISNFTDKGIIDNLLRDKYNEVELVTTNIQENYIYYYHNKNELHKIYYYNLIENNKYMYTLNQLESLEDEKYLFLRINELDNYNFNSLIKGTMILCKENTSNNKWYALNEYNFSNNNNINNMTIQILDNTGKII